MKTKIRESDVLRDVISTSINVHPLSVNEVWQGRRYKTQKYKEYEKEVLFILPKKTMIPLKVRVNLCFRFWNVWQRDIDNCIKPTLDLLVKKGYIRDDRDIVELHVLKKKDRREGIDIEISEI